MKESLQPLVIGMAPRYRELVYTALKEAILAGRFEPGLPLIEEQIAVALEISRTPVREALAILEHEGLIAPRKGRGLYVRELTREEFVVMFVANEVVEPYLVRRASLLTNHEQLKEMDAAINRGELCADRMDIPGFLRSGRDFHRLVGLASGNTRLTQFVGLNEERADLYLLSYGKVLDTPRMTASNREHRAILKAIVRRDPDEAARLVNFHCQSVRERLSPLFGNDDGEWEILVPMAAEAGERMDAQNRDGQHREG